MNASHPLGPLTHPLGPAEIDPIDKGAFRAQGARAVSRAIQAACGFVAFSRKEVQSDPNPRAIDL